MKNKKTKTESWEFIPHVFPSKIMIQLVKGATQKRNSDLN